MKANFIRFWCGKSEFMIKNWFHNWTSEFGCIWHIFGKFRLFLAFFGKCWYSSNWLYFSSIIMSFGQGDVGLFWENFDNSNFCLNCILTNVSILKSFYDRQFKECNNLLYKTLSKCTFVRCNVHSMHQSIPCNFPNL